MISAKKIEKITKALEGIEGYVLSMDVGNNEMVTISKNYEESNAGTTEKEPAGFRA